MHMDKYKYVVGGWMGGNLVQLPDQNNMYIRNPAQFQHAVINEMIKRTSSYPRRRRRRRQCITTQRLEFNRVCLQFISVIIT